MYCPVCFNDTLKIASSGVVKLTFNGKSKSTSQFFYDLKSDREADLQEKLEKVIADYFAYYSNFQNQDTIDTIEATSIDFVCSNGCVIGVNNRLNVVGLVITKEMIKVAAEKVGAKYKISVKL